MLVLSAHESRNETWCYLHVSECSAVKEKSTMQLYKINYEKGCSPLTQYSVAIKCNNAPNDVIIQLP